VTKSAVPYSYANRETRRLRSAESTEDDAFDSTRLSLSIGSSPMRRDTVEPADSNPLPAAADDQSNDDEAADESSDTSDPDNDFTPAPAPLPQRGGTMALIVDDSNYIVTAPVGATVKLSTTVVLPPSAMAAAAPAAVPAMAPVVPSVQRPAFVEVPDASNYIVASAAAVPFSASRNVGPVRALNESGRQVCSQNWTNDRTITCRLDQRRRAGANQVVGAARRAPRSGGRFVGDVGRRFNVCARLEQHRKAAWFYCESRR
jgi:hypothetical protein